MLGSASESASIACHCQHARFSIYSVSLRVSFARAEDNFLSFAAAHGVLCVLYCFLAMLGAVPVDLLCDMQTLAYVIYAVGPEEITGSTPRPYCGSCLYADPAYVNVCIADGM